MNTPAQATPAQAPSRTGRTGRNAAVLAVALLVALLSLQGPRTSSAIFTSSSQALSSVTAAADWTPPTVAVNDPGPSVAGAVTVRTTPADADSGVARVVVEGRAVGTSSWQQFCTMTAAPWTCSVQTTVLADGEYEVRARATDRAGIDAVSAVVRTTVANRAAVTLTAPASAVRGTVTLGTVVRDVGTLPHTVRIEHAPVGGTFSTLCGTLSSPYACSWDTTTVPSGPRQLRAVVLDAAGRTVATSPVVTVTVDNIAPTVTLTDPGSPLKGVRPVTVTANDAHSGVARVVVQAAPAGTSAWRDLCTATQSPWGCSVDTTSLTDGYWSFRAVATDAAGHSTTSAVIGNRLVENTAPAVSVDVRAGALAGTVPVGATATSAAGVTSVKLQVRRSGTTPWTDLCTDTVAPWSCDWNTLTVTNGTYELRAEMRDGLNRTVVSSVATRTVTNTPFTGVDVQTANGPGEASRPDRGDTVTFTYSHEVAPTSILAGWDGSSRAVTVTFADGGLFNLSKDTLDVSSPQGPVRLGTVTLNGDYVWWTRSIDFESTMVATTTTGPDGTQRTVVTLTLGASSYRGTDPVKSAGSADPGTMVWTPSALVTDIAGRSVSTTPVSETGTLDREF